MLCCGAEPKPQYRECSEDQVEGRLNQHIDAMGWAVHNGHRNG